MVALVIVPLVIIITALIFKFVPREGDYKREEYPHQQARSFDDKRSTGKDHPRGVTRSKPIRK